MIIIQLSVIICFTISKTILVNTKKAAVGGRKPLGVQKACYTGQQKTATKFASKMTKSVSNLGLFVFADMIWI